MSSSSSSVLLTPLKLGAIEAPNRVLMAPLTRGRASQETGVPNVALTTTYYTQRVSAGLIISEATAISRQGSGWLGAPGIYTDAQVAGWKPIVEAVHANGGRIVLQLWHMGRVSHPAFQEGGALPVGPSAIAAKGHSHTASGNQEYVVPRALETHELAGVVADYAHAARNAKAAGFDGVELHAANGYLVDQFLRDGSNQRTDAYGGSIENRARFLLEIVDALVGVWGADRVGVRVSPVGAYNDMRDSDPVALFSHVAAKLQERNIAYLHVLEGISGWSMNADAPVVLPHIRAAFRGPLVVNGGYAVSTAESAIAAGNADAVAFGAGWISNPDLVHRIRVAAEWAPPNPATFYSFEAEGYIDYPALA